MKVTLKINNQDIEADSKSETEVWRDISGYEGLYKISNLGRVLSLKRECLSNRPNVYREVKARFLKQIPNTRGYLRVSLAKNSNNDEVKVHKLVALHFINNPNPEKFNQINHLNGVKTDNRARNLEWCDSAINMKHAFENIAFNRLKGEQHPTAKLNAKTVSLIKALSFLGVKKYKIAKQLSLSRTRVLSALNNWAEIKIDNLSHAQRIIQDCQDDLLIIFDKK